MQLQLFFDKQIAKKQAQKELLADYKAMLENDKPYNQLISDISELRQKKGGIELEIKQKLGGLERFEEIKEEIKIIQDSMTAEAVEGLKNGEEIKVKDGFGSLYVPVWSVRFKKVKKTLQDFNLKQK